MAKQRVLERTGITQQREQYCQQDVRQLIEQRDAEWQQLLAQREAAWAKRETELTVQRQRYAEEHARNARRAAAVNVKELSRSRDQPETVDDTPKEIADRHYG